MIRNIAILLSAAALAAAADDPWDKVKELKSGAEIRIVRKGAAQPVEAKFGDLTDENLVIVVKNEQKAIPRDEIDRIDARPKGGRITTETKSKYEDPDTRPQSTPQSRAPVGGQSTSSGVNIGSKPAYETIYRRTPPPPAKK